MPIQPSEMGTELEARGRRMIYQVGVVSLLWWAWLLAVAILAALALALALF